MNRKGILLILLTTFAFMGGTLCLVYYRFSNLPHPKEASHNQLMYWMILRDLNRYDAEVHLALVNRFSEEAKQIFRESGSGSAHLSETQNKRLLSNIEILKKVWFQDRVSQYCDISQPETCEAFMSRQIQLLDDFGNIAFEHAGLLYPQKKSENLTTISDELFQDIDRWISDTPDEKRAETIKAIRDATVFWLSTEDLGEQVMSARQELVSRVIAELEKGMNLETTTSIVSDQRAKQLKENAMWLMEAWIHLLAEEYDELPKDDRTKFIDQKIADVKRWKLLEYLSNDSAGKTSPTAAISQFNQTLKQWLDRADTTMQAKIRKLQTAFQQRIFWTFLQSENR